MEVNLEKKDQLDAELTVKVDSSDYQEEFDNELKSYRKQAELPGFRKGKVPLGLLKQKLGTDLKKKLVPDKVNKAIQDYIQENDLKLLLNPLEKETEEPDWQNNDSFEFHYDVGLRPEMDFDLQEALGDLKQYKIEATQEEIDEQIQKIKNLKGTTENKEQVEDNDSLYVTIYVTELDDNGENLEGGLEKSKTLQLSELPDDLRKELVGKEVQEDFEANLKSYFESDEKAAEFLETDKLTVQDLGEKFNITVQSAYQFQQAELSEEIFKEVFPDKEIQNEEEFCEEIKNALESSYERESDGFLFKELKDKLVQEYDKELPEGFLKKWFDKVQEQEENQENQNQEEEKSHEEKYKEFLNDIKWMIVIDGLADRFEVTVEGNEVMEYAQSLIRNEISRIGMGDIGEDKVKEYAANYLQDQNNYFKSHFTLKEDKVFKHIKENVEFQQESVSYNEFQKIANPETDQAESEEQQTEKAEHNG